MEHQHVISSHHKEIQALCELVNLAMQRYDSLLEHTQTEIKDLSLFMNQQILFLREKVFANELRIAEQKQTIEALHLQLNEFHESYASKRSIEKLKGDFDLEIKASTISHLNSFQEFQRELKTLINSLKDDLIKLRSDTALALSELDKKIESKFSISRMDKDGISKEIRVYEKTIFIMEKKIENIYTLIERINKRGEICPKPE